MTICKIRMVCVIVGCLVCAVCYGEHLPRFGAVVTNDFTVADLELCFKKVETSLTNAVFQFRDDGPVFFYEVDEAGVRRCERGERISLSVAQRLRIVDRHAGLSVDGYFDDGSRGFLLTRYDDSRSFGRGVRFWTGRLLLSSRDMDVKAGDVVIVGAGDPHRGLASVRGTYASELKMFFDGLVKAYLSGDVDRINGMSGNSAEKWLRWLDGGEKLGGVEVVGCSTNDELEVLARITLLGCGDDPYSFDAKFSMRKDEGSFRIEDMELFDGWNRLFDATVETSAKLIKAINNRDIYSVRNLVSRCEGCDFNAVLAERGLTWIKSAMDAGIKIAEKRMKVQWTNGNLMVGRILIPDLKGGTNISRRIVFVGGKIKCDAMAENPATKMDFKDWLNAQYEQDRVRRENKRREKAKTALEEALKPPTK